MRMMRLPFVSKISSSTSSSAGVMTLATSARNSPRTCSTCCTPRGPLRRIRAQADEDLPAIRIRQRADIVDDALALAACLGDGIVKSGYQRRTLLARGLDGVVGLLVTLEGARTGEVVAVEERQQRLEAALA